MAPKPTPRFNPRGGDRQASGRRLASRAVAVVRPRVPAAARPRADVLAHAGRPAPIPYSEFKTLLKNGQIAEVAVGEQLIRGTLEAGAGADAQSKQFTTTRVDDPKLDRGARSAAGEVHRRAHQSLAARAARLDHPADLSSSAIWGFFFRRMSGAEGGVMSFARSRAKIYADDEVKVRFADVAGVDEAEEELKEIVEFLKTPKKYTNLGGRIPKGVLLVGPPGTGKTLLARAVAGEAHVPFFSLSGSEFVEMFVGVGAARIRDLFQQAEAKAPCIVFIDELDALGKVRVQSPFGSHEEREQTLNQLLAEMDGFDSRKGVIIMGATNRPEVLDPALLRPGRFDRQVLVDKPDVNGREEILRIHAKSVKLAPDVDLRSSRRGRPALPAPTWRTWSTRRRCSPPAHDKTAVGAKDFESAIDRLVAGLEKKRVMSTKERRDRRVSRVGPRDRRHRAAGPRPGAQDLDRAARVRRARLHDAAAARGSLPDDPRRSAQPARGAARRTDGRGDRARRDLDRRAERPPARDRHRARDGDRVRHERRAGRHQLRREQAARASSTCRCRRSAGCTARRRRRRSTPRSSAS